VTENEPMREPSVPSAKVRGPIDLVARMNESTSEDYAMVPYPARQQLGDHGEPYDRGSTEKPELHEMVDDLEPGEGSLHNPRLAEPNLSLARPVTYHLEATEPNAQADGGPGSSGYNVLNRGVPPADDTEYPGDVYTLEQGAGVRTFRLAEGVGDDERLGDPNEVVVGSVNPRNIKEDTRERSSQTPSVNDPYRNPDGSLKDPEEVQEAAPELPESDFGAKDVLEEQEAPAAAVDTEGAKNEGGNDPAEGRDQTDEPVEQPQDGGGDEGGSRRGGRRGGRRTGS
jgi:hypothetical protein